MGEVGGGKVGGGKVGETQIVCLWFRRAYHVAREGGGGGGAVPDRNAKHQNKT